MKMWENQLYILSGHQEKFPNYDVFLSINIILTLTKNEDPDEMMHFVAFHLGLHVLPKIYV